MKPGHPFCLLLFIFCFAAKSFGQTEKAQNPILFADVLVGHSWGGAGGFTGGAALYFQTGQNLISTRFTGTTRINTKILSPFVPIPVFEPRSSMEEYAVLYGRRFIGTGNAYSFSLGISHNVYREQVKNTAPPFERKVAGVGLPFEANIKWFKARKERFRIYGIFPVGKPTGFGGSIGFKVLGNISKYSYAGIALSFGLGYHKHYE